MTSKTTLNAKNLETLGAQRLAELLIEISTGSAARKRRLRMELAGNHSSAEVAREVRKRLGSIARAQTNIGWRKVKAVKADLVSTSLIDALDQISVARTKLEAVPVATATAMVA